MASTKNRIGKTEKFLCPFWTKCKEYLQKWYAFLYPMQQIARGIMFLTRQSIHQSWFFFKLIKYILFFEQTIASSVIEADQEASQSQIVISSENDLPGNYKLVMVTAANDNSTEEYMFSQSGTCKESLCCGKLTIF